MIEQTATSASMQMTTLVVVIDKTEGFIDIHRNLRFADDTKWAGAVESWEGWEDLQRDLDTLEHWAISNNMKFNKDKCWVLHLEQSDNGYKHWLGNKWLESSSGERNLGLSVDSRLSTNQQYALTAKRANDILGCICIKSNIASHHQKRWFSCYTCI